MRQTGALRTELKIKETNVYYPAFSKLLVTLPIASSTISSMAAYVLLVLFSMKLYLSMYFWGAWTGSWTFWNGKYRKRGLEELCSLITFSACCVLEDKRDKNGFLYWKVSMFQAFGSCGNRAKTRCEHRKQGGVLLIFPALWLRTTLRYLNAWNRLLESGLVLSWRDVISHFRGSH